MQTLDELIAEAIDSGGSERANYQLFISGLCHALGLPAPVMSSEFNHRNDYVYERKVDFRHPDGTVTPGFIDCYKRGSFVLEAKQSARRQALDAHQADMFGSEGHSRRLGHARRGSAGWDRVMRAAYRQAVDYTRHLPVEHGYPPFVILVDVGNVIELYADFSGQGKNYAQFPDAQSFRIAMDDLRDPAIQARLKAVWTDPHSLDPAKKSAEVTRDIAGRLARIAKNLEGKHDPRDVAEFLMRCLFTMFAEDVGLLPDNLMVDLLEKLVDHPERFVPAMQSLWTTMDKGGFEPHSMADLKHFNGGLFAHPKALPLAPEDIHELLVAARQDWRDVEPAIFGTLLERALDPRERSKLGAHYTPRAYVERLVVPTIIEPLREQWIEAQAKIEEALRLGNAAKALADAKAFHHELCTVRVLDPACGTGNFLYVSLELMKKLEGEVLAAIDQLGEDQSRLMMEGETVNPRQFYGLELNPRAVPIADLVLWIGYLKWQLRTAGLSAISEPVLHAYGTIRQQDAILDYDSRDLVRDDHGAPVTRWDGITRMPHPITGELVPDPQARIELHSYKNPRPADWPEVEFIVGNPPFIGSKSMRAELGDGYAEAVWKARPKVPGGADFVMHFWDVAAERLTRKSTKAHPNVLRRFGFITTNSITQTFSRRVIERHMAAKLPLSLVFAVADHPWMKAADKAAVRIAMTVAEAGETEGVLATVTKETGLNSDAPIVRTDTVTGRIKANLVLGAEVFSARGLFANEAICSFGMALHGQGFVLSPREAAAHAASVAKPYAKGKDLLDRGPKQYVIDFSGLTSDAAQLAFPWHFQRLLETVKPERDENARDSIRESWWLYGWDRPVLRSALAGVQRYVATTETSKHRVFQFLHRNTIPDHMIVATAIDKSDLIAVLCSRQHVSWALAAGGTLEDRPRYSKSRTFDPFPFPDLSVNPELQSRLAALGERLDAFRKARLAAHEFLTMTGLYNSLERVRELEWKAGPGRAEDSAALIEPLSQKERDAYDAGHIAILKDIHDEIDTLVFAAYGWSDLAPRLVGRPGATTPSPYKTADQLAAEEELLTRLVALNQARAAEEARGLVRWLRPDYQIAKLGHKIAHPDGVQAEADLAILPGSDKPAWPADSDAQISVLVDVLRKAPAPLPPEALATAFDGRNTPKRRDRIASLLDTLTTIGLARTGQLDGQTRYFIPR
ncbi:DNA methyltransferase [Devosia sp. FKR38]|uniref:class I SAM-dependent DNA methyltransferase n=1 Tax=Devosia sp. FKR38 TaxID=2562312 RepID=UPI0010C10126|nr:DNA methyltransferase [Devosia sp. FKR38]